MRWTLSWRADPAAAAISDRHYNRRAVGAKQFVPPGACVVLLHQHALWVTSYSKPEWTKHQWPGAWVNSTFRNEGAGLSSELIVEACAATRALWGDPPSVHGVGFITFIDRTKVRSKKDPGYCYLKAGWEYVGSTPGGHGRQPLTVLGLRPERFPPPCLPLGAQLDLVVG